MVEELWIYSFFHRRARGWPDGGFGVGGSPVKGEPPTATADFDATVVTMSGKRLVITGTTASVSVVVRIAGTPFSTRSTTQKTFRFNVPYSPPTCIVTLATDLSQRRFLVADCGPRGEQGVQGPVGARGALAPVARSDLEAQTERPALRFPDSRDRSVTWDRWAPPVRKGLFAGTIERTTDCPSETSFVRRGNQEVCVAQCPPS